jgi:hypothetical protein
MRRLAEAQSSKPDAPLNFSGGPVAAGIGVSWGNGTLSYNGNTHPVRIEGLSVGAAGVTRATAKANVFASVMVGLEGIRLTLVNCSLSRAASRSVALPSRRRAC